MGNLHHDHRASPALLGIMVLVAGFILILYWPAQANGFVWDDWDYLLNPDFLDPGRWADTLKQPLVFSPNYFRPLALASLMFEAYLHGGADAYSMHVTNLMLHAMNSALAALLGYLVARHMELAPGREHVAALIIGLLYGSHPALVETVAWISGRFDLLLTTFLLLGLIANSVISHRIVRALLVGLSFFAASTAKEMAVVFPLVIAFWNLAWSPRERLFTRQLLPDMAHRGELGVYLALLLAGVLYLLLREWSLGYLYQSVIIPSTVELPGILQKVLLSAEALVRYVFVAVAPYATVNVVHPHRLPVPLTDVLAWISVVASAGFGVLLAVLLKGRYSRVGWMWVAFLASLLPVLHIVPLSIGNNIIQDRYLTFPLTLFYITAATTVAAFWPRDEEATRIRGKLRMGIAALLLLIAGNLITVRQAIPFWRDDLSLWVSASYRSPDSVIAHVNLSAAYLKANELSAGLAHAQKAIELSPISPAGWGMASKALARLEDPAAAAYEKTAISLLLDEPSPNEYCNVANAFMSSGRYSDAKRLLISIYPRFRTDQRINVTLGIISSHLGESESARLYFNEARSQFPIGDRKRFDAEIARILGSPGSSSVSD